ncbi:MAG: hypothetical protein AAB518_00155 [Patescibacteria group bacterium]
MRNWLSLDKQVWAASILNAVFIWWQVYVACTVKTSEGMSLFMWSGFLWVDIFFVAVGHRDNRRGMFWGMGFSALGCIAIILRILYLRS